MQEIVDGTDCATAAAHPAVISRPGRVQVAADGELEVISVGGCSSCAQPCLGGTAKERTLPVAGGYKPGMGVTIRLVRSGFGKACAWVFGLPIVGLIGGAMVGERFLTELDAVAGAFLGVLIAAVCVLTRREQVTRWVQLEVSAPGG